MSFPGTSTGRPEYYEFPTLVAPARRRAPPDPGTSPGGASSRRGGPGTRPTHAKVVSIPAKSFILSVFLAGGAGQNICGPCKTHNIVRGLISFTTCTCILGATYITISEMKGFAGIDTIWFAWPATTSPKWYSANVSRSRHTCCGRHDGARCAPR